MNKKLLYLLVPGSDDPTKPEVRTKCASCAGIVGILSNFLLAVMKMVMGIITNSISITADAVNNLTDAASSVITLIGFRLSSKPADKEHPYGHRRIEYLTGLIVSMVITVLGVDFFISSATSIFSPEPTEFSPLAVVILVVSIAVKLWQCGFYITVGKHIESTALIAAASDSRNDVVTTFAVLVGALISKFTGVDLDGWFGCAVAGFIIWSGINLVIETSDPLLGEAPSPELVKKVGDRIMSYDGILGYHDLVIHDYGPDRCFASVHAEVPAEQNIIVSHDLIDRIENDFLKETGIHVVIHLDPVVTNDPEQNRLHGELLRIMNEVSEEVGGSVTMHDFRMVRGTTHTNLIFDIAVPVDCGVSDKALVDLIDMKIHERMPGNYNAVITCDRDYTSTVMDESKNDPHS